MTLQVNRVGADNYAAKFGVQRTNKTVPYYLAAYGNINYEGIKNPEKISKMKIFIMGSGILSGFLTKVGINSKKTDSLSPKERENLFFEKAKETNGGASNVKRIYSYYQREFLSNAGYDEVIIKKLKNRQWDSNSKEELKDDIRKDMELKLGEHLQIKNQKTLFRYISEVEKNNFDRLYGDEGDRKKTFITFATIEKQKILLELLEEAANKKINIKSGMGAKIRSIKEKFIEKNSEMEEKLGVFEQQNENSLILINEDYISCFDGDRNVFREKYPILKEIMIEGNLDGPRFGDDMNDIVKGIKIALKKDGVFTQKELENIYKKLDSEKNTNLYYYIFEHYGSINKKVKDIMRSTMKDYYSIFDKYVEK